MQKIECFCNCHKDDEKNLLINQLKSKIYDAEQRINDLLNIEEYNKELKEENIKLIEEKNNLEYELKQVHDFYENNISIKESIENTKKLINQNLYDENENLKNELEKIINDYDYLKVGFEKLLESNKIIQSENKKFISQNLI